MNILIVNYEYPPLGGGGGVATKDLAEHLAQNHSVHVITSAFEDLAEYEQVGGVHVHRVPVLGRTQLPIATIISMLTFVPMALFHGIRVCRVYDFHVINAQFVIPSGIPAVLLAKIFRIPFVLSLIGGDLYDPSKGVSPHRHAILRMLIRKIAQQAQAITAISQDTKERAQHLHGIRQPITVIPIGLVPTHYGGSGIDAGASEFSAVSIGRLIPRKGYEVLINAWQQVPAGTLVIIGSGPLKDKLLAQIERLGLTGRVHILGAVSEQEKQRRLHAARIYVSAARHEGFGIVFLEAMQAGLPIVAPNEGGQTDFLTDGEHAFLVDPTSAAAVAQAVNRFAGDVQLCKRMGATNRKAVQKFMINQTAMQFEAVLERAVNVR